MASELESVAWDDLRLCLEVRRAGAVSTAAKRLGLSHSTVLRRVAALEQELGVILFIKRAVGYEATDAGRSLTDAAADIEVRIGLMMAATAAFDGGMAGSIRFAVPDLAATALMPVLAAFSAAHPDIEFSLLPSQTPESLTRGDAHVALVLTRSPPAGQIGVDLGPAAFAPYVARDAPEPREGAGLAWIGLVTGLRHIPVGNFDGAAAAARGYVHRAASPAMQHAAIAGGLGVGMLPCAVGDLDHRLNRCGDPVIDPSQRLWLLYRREMKGTQRIMIFFRFLRSALKREKALICGQQPACILSPAPVARHKTI